MSGDSGGTSKTVSTQELGPEQQKLMDLAMPGLEEYAKKDLQLFPGSTIAPFNETQLAARDDMARTAYGVVKDLGDTGAKNAQALTSAGTAGGLAGAGQGLQAGSTATQGLGDIFNQYNAGSGSRNFIESGALLNPNTNVALQGMTEAALRPLTQDLTEQVLPQISSDYVGGNMFGSSRQGIAEGQAIDDYMTVAGETAANIQNNAFNSGLDAMVSSLNQSSSAATSGLGAGLEAGSGATSSLLGSAASGMELSPALAELALLPSSTLEAIGQSQQAMDQALLTEEADRFTTEQMMDYLQAQDIANLAYGLGGGSAVTEATQGSAYDPMQTALGAAGTFASLMPLLGLSDRRLKENITPLLTTSFGTKYYSFNFLGSNVTQMGVMADEVPHAIAGEINGYSVVNYALV